MAFVRRFLPSTSLLCSFEAAARHQSFTEAARELSLTQSAVSRQIRALEELLGADLFLRERQTVKLTAAGANYAREIRESLKRISGATLSFRANPDGESLTIAVLPTFGRKWLAPRIAGFIDKYPGVKINIVTRLEAFEFGFENIHAAVHFGLTDKAGVEFDFLMRENVIPVCSPDLLENNNIATASDLGRLPLLHLTSRPDAWERWFASQGTEVGELRGMLLDQFSIVAEIAVQGLGVALLPEFLIEAELATGQLVRALDVRVENVESYFLAWPPENQNYPALVKFRAWIVEEARNAVACSRAL